MLIPFSGIFLDIIPILIFEVFGSINLNDLESLEKKLWFIPVPGKYFIFLKEKIMNQEKKLQELVMNLVQLLEGQEDVDGLIFLL